MWRPLALVFLARVFSGCGTDAPDGIAERNEDKGQMCRAAEILVQAPDSMIRVPGLDSIPVPRWREHLEGLHQRLPGDHKGNSIIRFFWKGAGVGDDKWI